MLPMGVILNEHDKYTWDSKNATLGQYLSMCWK